MLDGKRILLIVSGGIAAYKSLELVRLLQARGASIRAILTAGGAHFVTPLSLAALTQNKVHEDLFSLTDEAEMGHIRLSREADLLLIAPASADFLAKMRAGLADDLATTVLLATDKPVMAAPAMNHRMWTHAATRENLDVLAGRGVHMVGPEEGDMACGEFGPGRMAEPATIADAVEVFLAGGSRPNGRLKGRRAVVTSGPTVEAVDPVRYLSNHSSGRQGHAIADALAAQGADTVLVSGPTDRPDPPGVRVVHVRSAADMLEACEDALPADIVVCAAAVADWRVAEPSPEKIKKNGETSALQLVETTDILARLSRPGSDRPRLVVGFAAETGRVLERAADKREAKGCDWIIANDVSPGTDVFGGADNTVHVIDADGAEDWPKMSKEEVGRRLALRIAAHLAKEA